MIYDSVIKSFPPPTRMQEGGNHKII